MSAFTWYGHGLGAWGEWAVPAPFVADPPRARVIGGHLDGAREAWPHELGTIRVPTLLDDNPFDIGRSLSSSRVSSETYHLHRCVHTPGLDAEGPIGVEWVWMPDRAFRAVTGESLR